MDTSTLLVWIIYLIGTAVAWYACWNYRKACLSFQKTVEILKKENEDLYSYLKEIRHRYLAYQMRALEGKNSLFVSTDVKSGKTTICVDPFGRGKYIIIKAFPYDPHDMESLLVAIEKAHALIKIIKEK